MRRSASRWFALLAVWLAPTIVLIALVHATIGSVRIAPPSPLNADTRATITASIRRGWGEPAAFESPRILGEQRASGRVFALVWSHGKVIARLEHASGRWRDIADSFATNLANLPAITRLDPEQRDVARIEIDIEGGSAELWPAPWLVRTLALEGMDQVPPLSQGLDGIAVELADKSIVTFLPGDVVFARTLQVLPSTSPFVDLMFGIDRSSLDGMVATRAHIRFEDLRAQQRRYFRVRYDTFIESPIENRDAIATVPLRRGNTAAPAVTSANLRAAALAGGQYLVSHLANNGRFVYENNLTNNLASDPIHGGYNIPRHAGSVYFLAQLLRVTHAEYLREPLELAIKLLADLVDAGGCRGTLADGSAYACVLDHGETSAQLGSTALAVVALVEYQRATGDARFLDLATRMAAWILMMQRSDGSFRHLYTVATHTPDNTAMLQYFSGEATLALARMNLITGDAKYASATERGLDWLVHWYDFFVGGMMFGEEHWTCISAEAAFPTVHNPEYRAFCDAYGQFLRPQQASEAESGPNTFDMVGGYAGTPFVLPFNTPTSSRTEAMLSTYQLETHEGHADPVLWQQIETALAYLLGQQIREDNDFSVAAPDSRGAMPESPLERTVRIDYVQHSCSAMIRAAEILEADGR